MKLYKKSQTTGRHVILMTIILLAVLLVVAIIILQSKGIMTAYLDKIFS